MAKMIAFDQEAQEKIRAGVSKLAKAVRVTLGPRGRNVILQKSFGSPTVTKDGVTVAREVELSDKFEDMGAKMVKEVASKTSDVAGDGTTTATIMAEAVYNEGLRAVVSGVNPVEMKRGMDAAVEAVVEKLKGMSIECRNKKSIAQVATVAANGDSEIGDILADAMEKVGKDGVITVEEGKSLKTDYTVVEGMQFDRGFLSPYFVTDPQTMEAVLEDCYVLVHEKKISNIKDLIPILEKVVNAGKPLLIIAEEVEGEALSTLVINKLRGTFRCVAVKAPGYGDRRKAMLQDIAIMVGGTAVFEDLGIQLDGIELAELGRVKKVVVDKDNTTLIEGHGKSADIKARIDQIRKERENSTSDYDREKLDERIAKLSGGVAQVNVGAATESEMKEKKARVEDALHATRAAVAEGILPGGGVALLRASNSVKPSGLSDDAVTGFNIILRACKAPVTQIANNAGVDGGVICEKVGELSGNMGYNAATGKFEDLVKTGIIDPTKVTRSALQNAASVATLLLTSDALIAEKPKDEAALPAGGHGGGIHVEGAAHARQNIHHRLRRIGPTKPHAAQAKNLGEGARHHRIAATRIHQRRAGIIIRPRYIFGVSGIQHQQNVITQPRAQPDDFALRQDGPGRVIRIGKADKLGARPDGGQHRIHIHGQVAFRYLDHAAAGPAPSDVIHQEAMGRHHKLCPLTAIGKDQQRQQFIRSIAANNPRRIKPETRANRFPQRLGTTIGVAMRLRGHAGNGGNGAWRRAKSAFIG